MGDRQKRRGLLRWLLDLVPAAPASNGNGARVTADATRCVQCGVCGYNCPAGIPVRDFARQGLAVDDPRCVQCGQCIEVCPRGTLRWDGPADLQRMAWPAEASSGTNGRAGR
jgi:ferredoxin